MKTAVRLLGFALAAGIILNGTPARPAVPDKLIEQAVERGVAGLKKLQQPSGQFGGYGSGSTALAAITLLECGVAPDDEVIRKAAEVVRNDCPTLNQVYHLSLAVMLFDRLGDSRDVPLIQALSVRLLEGQFPEGGWSYKTPPVDESEVQRLKALVKQRAELKTQPGGPPPIDPGLQERLRRLGQKPSDEPGRIDSRLGKPEGIMDNSNTQFAILALWVARRHSIPADDALRRAERYFRATHEGPTWYYICYLNNQSEAIANRMAPRGRGAMTCSGLLGLAIGAGIVRENQMRTAPEGNGKAPALRDPLRDPLIQAALNFVGEQVALTPATWRTVVPTTGNDYYFLWSVERVAMIYSLKLMGGRDWYQIGSSVILRLQDPNTGLWTGTYGPEIDSSFALLFLRRANFARDLTANLLSKDRGSATLKSGDVRDNPPPAKTGTASADQLGRELLAATPQRQPAILDQLRDGKGSEFTDALIRAIPQLTGDIQRQGRDALAERMSRMTADTVRACLRDNRAELRRAAALASAMKEEKALIPDLIAVLDDTDQWVVRAAAVALRSLTGQDFGPSANATNEESRKAVAAWKDWWKRQGGR